MLHRFNQNTIRIKITEEEEVNVAEETFNRMVKHCKFIRKCRIILY